MTIENFPQIALVESKGLKEGLKGRKKHQHNTASDTTIGSFDVTKGLLFKLRSKSAR